MRRRILVRVITHRQSTIGALDFLVLAVLLRPVLVIITFIHSASLSTLVVITNLVARKSGLEF